MPRVKSGVAHHGLHLSAQSQYPQPQTALAIGRAPDEGVRFEGHDEPIDDRSADAENCGQLGDGKPIRGLGHHLEDPQPSVKRLRGLRCHQQLPVVRGVRAPWRRTAVGTQR